MPETDTRACRGCFIPVSSVGKKKAVLAGDLGKHRQEERTGEED